MVVLFTMFSLFLPLQLSLLHEFKSIFYQAISTVFTMVSSWLSSRFLTIWIAYYASFLIQFNYWYKNSNRIWWHPKHPELLGSKTSRNTCLTKTQISVFSTIPVDECLKLTSWIGPEFIPYLITMTFQNSLVSNSFMRELGILAFTWLLQDRPSSLTMMHLDGL